MLATDIVAWEVPVPPDVSGTLIGLNEAVIPEGAEYERLTLPENPLTLFRLMVDVPEEP